MELANVFDTDIAIPPNHVMVVWSVLECLVKSKSVTKTFVLLMVNGHSGPTGLNVLGHVTAVSEIVGGHAMHHNAVGNSVKAIPKNLPGVTLSHVLPTAHGQTGLNGHNAVFHVVVESKLESEIVTTLHQLMVVLTAPE